MIEVVIDFDEISKNSNLSSNELVLYLSKKLGLPYKDRVGKWDAFSDNFSDLFFPEIDPNYKYDPNDEWGWSDYQDYASYLKMDRKIGNKNEKGLRDDLKIIFVNYYSFYNKYPDISNELIRVMISSYVETKYNKFNDHVFKFELCIKS